MTRASLARKILALHRKGGALNIHAVKKSHPELLEAAYSFTPFLGWKQAIELASLDYRSIRIELEPYVTCLICGESLRFLSAHLHKSHGISSSEYREEFPGAALKSEECIADSTGPAQGPVPHWEPLLSLEYILDRAWFWHSQYGRVDPKFMLENDRTIVSASSSRGYAWRKIIGMIGLDARKELLQMESVYQSRAQVVQALKLRAEKGEGLTQPVVVAEDSNLKSSIYQFFGSWEAAMEAADVTGLYEQQKHFNIRHKKNGRYPTREDMIAALRLRDSAGLSVLSSDVHREDPTLRSIIYVHFGDWHTAIKAAGLWDKYRKNTKAVSPYPDAASVLGAIRKRAAGKLSISSRVVQAEDSALRSAAYRFFSSWVAALEAAGFQRGIRGTPSPYPDRAAVVNALKQRASAGLPLTTATVSADDYSLYHAAIRSFSGWVAAIRAAGLWEVYITHPQVVVYPDKASAIAALRNRAARGLSLVCQCISMDDSALKSACLRLFGSWGATIKAARLEDIYRRDFSRIRSKRMRLAARTSTGC